MVIANPPLAEPVIDPGGVTIKPPFEMGVANFDPVILCCLCYTVQDHDIYSKRHNKFLFPALAGAIYGSFCKAENEISNVVNYKTGIQY